MSAILAPAQQAAVEHDGGPLLLLGGPGTGKTFTLEQRYLRLAAAEGLAPHRILMLCTNRAYAQAAKDRLIWALPRTGLIEVPVCTWHALAFQVVAARFASLGFKEPPVLLTSPEQWGLVRSLLAGEPSSDWPEWRARLRDNAFVDEVTDFCLRVQQRMMTDEDLSALGEARPAWAEVVRFYRRYREALRSESRLDYAGLLASAAKVLEVDEEARSGLRKRFPQVLVDDAQEMGPAQRRLLSFIAGEGLVVAADPDSGVESFRGGEPDWIYGFERWFGPSTTLTLEASHRVGEPLASAAQALISHNQAGSPAPPPQPAAHQTTFECRAYPSAAGEMEAVARELRRRHLLEGIAWEDMAVLVSQPRFLIGPLERALEVWEVPFRPQSGDRSLAAEPAVGSFLDLARVALGTEGWEEILPGLLTSQLVGLDYGERRRLEREAWRQRRPLAELIEESPEAGEYRALRDLVAGNQTRADICFWEVYSASSFYRRLEEAARSGSSDAADASLDGLVAFSRALERFVERRHGKGSMLEYLNEAARADFGGDPWAAPLRGEAGGRVALLSFHAAQGRQWHTVIVTGCLDTWIPKGRRAQGLFDPFLVEAGAATEREVEAIAEDRRTFYVAATRASHHVIFTASPGSSGRERPSRFLVELAGEPPAEAGPADLPPLTHRDMRARLRRLLASGAGSQAEQVAAIAALAEVPGTDPSRWYWRWDWTEGSSPLVEGELVTSYSRLGLYEDCGLKYLLVSVLGLDPASSHHMKFGTWLHSLFEAVHTSRVTSPRQLMQAYGELFDESVFPNAIMARQFRRDGELILKTFWEHEAGVKDVLAEHWFGDLHFEGAQIRGRIDRVDRVGKALKLTDYKTAKWAPTPAEAKKSLQLAIYHLAARSDPVLMALGSPLLARLVYLGSYWSNGEYKVLNQTPEEADAVIETLPGMIARIKSEDFRPSPRADCHFCEMKPLCPLWPQGREVPA